MKIDWEKIGLRRDWQTVVGWGIVLLIAGSCFGFAVFGWRIAHWNWLSFIFAFLGIAVIFAYWLVYHDTNEDLKKYYGPGKWPGT